MQKPNSNWRSWLAAIIVLATLYAAVRYHVAQPEPWSRFYFWTVNKAISFSAAALLAASYSYITHSRRTARALGLSGFVLALVHSFLSWPLLGAANYPKLYTGGSLNSVGVGCVISGIAAMVLLLGPALTSFFDARARLGRERWTRLQRLGYASLALTSFHVFVYGYKGWLTPLMWPAAMPPITLLAFLLGSVPVLRWLIQRKANAHV
jgi:DMSO/TMAO reductase YedYZ heme-binding membrane subunit